MRGQPAFEFPVSWRCGCNPNARQIRDTAVCDRPTSVARDRVDQCVASSGVVSNVVVITRSSASTMGTATGLGIHPSNPLATINDSGH